MAQSIKGSETEKNLLKTFAGESQARMRYTYFAEIAHREGYLQIAAIFEETANQEMAHAKRMFKFLEGGMLEITATYPAGIISDTLSNLKEAAEGEHEEWYDDYPKFADIAEQEGFMAVAKMYREVSKAEQGHEARYRKLIANMENDEVFKRSEPVKWQCRNCGYIHEGEEAPKACPACLVPQCYFEIEKENY